MRRVLVGLVVIGCSLGLIGCHPTAADSPGANPVPPADAPSDSAAAASTNAPADAPSGSVSAD